MRSTSSILAGTVAASLLAGPLLLSSCIASLMIQYPAEIPALNARDVGLVILLLAASIPTGFFLAGLPIFLGAAVMSWLGWCAPESRSHAVWAAAGAAFATVLSIPFVAWLAGDSRVDTLGWILSFTIPGIICALVCRHLTAWPDEN
jgi:hypothetical protein